MIWKIQPTGLDESFEKELKQDCKFSELTPWKNAEEQIWELCVKIPNLDKSEVSIRYSSRHIKYAGGSMPSFIMKLEVGRRKLIKF